jgi:dienelactone hydrolase
VAPAGGTRGWTSAERRQAVFEIMDGLLAEFPIDRQRIYLMGFSLGGGGVWNYLQQRPGFFAAANPQAPAGGSVDPELVKRVTYLLVISVLFPLVIWTGLAMSPALVSAVPVAVTVFGGKQSARTIHFFVSLSLLLFLLVHVAMICLAGFRSRMRAMITGQAGRNMEGT